MSMYNLVFGDASHLLPLAYLFGITEIPRYRDLWVEKNDDPEKVTLVIYTRTGGGNREEYLLENARLAEHPGYVGDEDDSFDSTYATFKFVVSKDMLDLNMVQDDFRDDIDGLWAAIKEEEVEPVDPSERWQEAIKALEDRVKHPDGQAS